MSNWCTIAPILPDWRGIAFELADSVDLGAGVRLIRAPDWLRDNTVTKWLSSKEREHFDRARFALSINYDAEALGEPDPQWTRPVGMSKQSVATEKLIVANLGLWLARPSWLAFEAILDVAEYDGQWIVRAVHSPDPARPHRRDAENTLTIEDLDLARTIGERAWALPIESAPWRALLMLWRSLAEVSGDHRFLFLWIGLEALFGPSSASETTFRLSQRLAFFVSKDRAGAGDLYRRAKSAYALRSRIVHGFQIDRLKGDAKDALLVDSETWIRVALQKIILDGDLRRTFETDKRREEFLETLVF